MGVVNSCCIPRNANPNLCKENHTSTPKIKGHKRNLSAAFNFQDIQEANYTMEQLNINTASEEELMTLPGINRVTAQNIVEYRRQIGGFKKVEDLALVSGVGATKLTQIKMEICVSRKRMSPPSSTTSSKNDLSIQDNTSRSSNKSCAMRSLSGVYYPKVNVNTSNVFQLMKVKGITQAGAENIVAYRDRKGYFRSIDEVLKVRGMKPAFLSAIRPYLVLSGSTAESPTAPATPITMNGSLYSSSHNHTYPNFQANGGPLFPLSQTTTNFHKSASQEDLLSLYGPLIRKSFRKKVDSSKVSFKQDSDPLVRIASWNLDDCSVQKAENPGVKEVVCMTILENGLSIIAVQGLLDKDALQILCDELNVPSIPNVKNWKGEKGTWKCVTSDEPIKAGPKGNVYSGFLYDSSQSIRLLSVSLLDKPADNTHNFNTKPCMSLYTIDRWQFLLVSLQLNDHENKGPSGTENGSPNLSEISKILEAIHKTYSGEKDVIILGDFSSGAYQKDVTSLVNQGFKSVLPITEKTNSDSKTESKRSLHDNIWLNEHTQKQHPGKCGSIREGLTSPWIPNGWAWGGVVSDHCPVWAEFCTTCVRPSSLVPNLDANMSIISTATAGNS